MFLILHVGTLLSDGCLYSGKFLMNQSHPEVKTALPANGGLETPRR